MAEVGPVEEAALFVTDIVGGESFWQHHAVVFAPHDVTVGVGRLDEEPAHPPAVEALAHFDVRAVFQ